MSDKTQSNIDQESEDEVFTVERILDMKTDASGQELFLIKWLGYPEEDNTWEPRGNLESCLILLERFEKAHKKRLQQQTQQLQTQQLSKTKKNSKQAKSGKNATSSDCSVSLPDIDAVDEGTISVPEEVSPSNSEANVSAPSATSQKSRTRKTPAKSKSLAAQFLPSPPKKAQLKLTRSSAKKTVRAVPHDLQVLGDPISVDLDEENGSIADADFNANANVGAKPDADTDAGDDTNIDAEEEDDADLVNSPPKSSSRLSVSEDVNVHKDCPPKAKKTFLHDNGFTKKLTFRGFDGVSWIDGELNFLVKFDEKTEVISSSVLKQVAKDELIDYLLTKVKVF